MAAPNAAGTKLIGHGGKVQGCVPKRGGDLQVVKAGKHCPKGKVSLVLSARGGNGANGSNGSNGSNGPQGPQGVPGPPGGPGPAGPSGTTVITQPAAWVLHSAAPQSDAVALDAGSSDKSADEQFQGFKFGGFGGPDTLTGTFQTFLLSPSQLSGSTVNLSSVSFCYFVGPYPPGNTETKTVIDHIWIFTLTEPSGGTTAFPPTTVGTLLDQSISSIKNNTGNCKSFSLSAPQPVPTDGYVLLRLEGVDNQSTATTSGALVQLGRVTATYTP